MADEPIRFRRTTNPAPVLTSYDGTAPLKAGEPVIALAPSATKLWIGDGTANRLLLSTDAADTPVFPTGTGTGMTEPAADGAYLRVKSGTAYSWENKVYNYRRESALEFSGTTAGGDAELPYMSPLLKFDVGMCAAVAVNGVFESAGISVESGHPPGSQFQLDWSSGIWSFSRGGAFPLFVDNIGENSGIRIDNGGSGAGLEVFRHTAAGPSIKLMPYGVKGSPKSPADHLFGNIVFAGVIGRESENYWAGGAVPYIWEGRVRHVNASAIQAVASEPWRSTQNWNANFDGNTVPLATGSRLEFFTTPNGTTGPQKTFVVDHDGNLLITRSGALTELATLLGGPSTEPPADGAYLRVKDGGSYSWENKVLRTFTGTVGTTDYPILSLNKEGGTGAVISVNSYVGSITSAPLAALVTTTSSHAPTIDFQRDTYVGSGIWLTVPGDAAGLYVENLRDRAGIVVENAGGPISRGVDVFRYHNSGPSIRLTHHPIPGSTTSPPGGLLGNIAFAGIYTRSMPFEGPVIRSTGAGIQAVATESWGQFRRGTRLEFLTTPNDTTTPQQTLVIDHNGDLLIRHNGVLMSLLERLDERYARLAGGNGNGGGPTVPGPFSLVLGYDELLFEAAGPSEIATLEVDVIVSGTAAHYVEIFKGPTDDYDVWNDWPALWISIGTLSLDTAVGVYVMTLSQTQLAAGECLYEYGSSAVPTEAWLKLTLVSGEGTGPKHPRP